MCSQNRRRCTPTATNTATPSRSGRSSAPRGGRVLALDVTTGAEIDRPLDPQQGPVCGLAVTPDATRLIELTSCLDRAAAFAEWRLDGGGPVSRLVVDTPTPKPSYLGGFGYGGDDSAFVVEFASPSDEQPVTHVIDAASGDVLERFPGVYGLFPTADPDVAIAIFDEDGTVGRFDSLERAGRSDHRSWLRDPRRVDERQPGQSSKLPVLRPHRVARFRPRQRSSHRAGRQHRRRLGHHRRGDRRRHDVHRRSRTSMAIRTRDAKRAR